MIYPVDDVPRFDRRELSGPFDLIGDVHGCMRELVTLLEQLGYRQGDDGHITHQDERMAVLLGDIVDRGPNVVGVIQRVSRMVEDGSALYVPGNHDERMAAYLMGASVPLAHGLQQTVEQLERVEPVEREETIERFLDLYLGAAPYLWLDEGRLVAVHGGLEEDMIRSFDREIWQFCLLGKIAEDGPWPGFVRRIEWAPDYTGEALVAYGHTPCQNAELLNNTVNLDQGCVFGGSLSAYRYPEGEVVQVRAARAYYRPVL